LAPPMGDGTSREGRSVMRDTHRYRSTIGEQIIDTVRDGDAGRVGAEVVVVDQTGEKNPNAHRDS
jgi:hypothetical protein